MGIDEVVFYVWFIFSITILFYVLITILELFFPKVESFISKFKNYLTKGGVS